MLPVIVIHLIVIVDFCFYIVENKILRSDSEINLAYMQYQHVHACYISKFMHAILAFECVLL